ncbi:hypothetical protein D9M73_284920 [compost metagenome]
MTNSLLDSQAASVCELHNTRLLGNGVDQGLSLVSLGLHFTHKCGQFLQADFCKAAYGVIVTRTMEYSRGI